jgi:glycosyltransferase involved in cell wall biosynthesis
VTLRIIYASERPPYPFFLGGAARSAHYLLATLARDFGAQVLAVGSRDFSGSAWVAPAPQDHAALDVSAVEERNGVTTAVCGYPVRVLPGFPQALRQVMDAFAPDVVWAQLDGIETVVHTARQAGRRVVVYLRDAEDPPALLRTLAAQGCGFVCNSRFMAERVRRLTGKTAGVIYPSLESDFGVQGDPQGFLSMINPHRVKGLQTFLEVARRMPHERFLLVESWTLAPPALAALKEQLAGLPNVTFWHRVPDAAAIYRQTRLMLVPSVWEEAFGRVAIEAQSCGIPVIASRRGGLPESVGDGGVCIDAYLDPDAWVRAIAGVTGDRARYDALAARARAHASRDAFKPQEAARCFLAFCAEPAHFRRPLGLALRAGLGRLLGRAA